ncbi:MAG TPA: hypothetical protein VLM41_05720 [Steroidobacteraceae bacterium]|nr:hypothetical protein [Steroidobacteraceae bacterium]
MSRFVSNCLLAVLAGGALASLPVAADDITDLRAELESLKAQHAAQIASLEARIVELESAQAAAATVAPATEAAPLPSAGTDMKAFNPAISVILAGNYANLSQDPGTWAIAGFIPAGEEIGPGERSFNLGESELTLSGSIDPYFMGSITAALSPENEIAVEEAYFRTLALPAGLMLKGGRFFSGLGYLNEIHAHAWDFIDQPLVYQAFYGGQFAQDGLQLKWLAPTDLFVEFGAETGNGESFPGTRRGVNGANGVTLFAHLGGDFADDWAWRGGVSWMELRAVEREYEDVNALDQDVINAFTGKSRTWIVDATLKWTRPGDPKRRSLKLQGEYMHRSEDGQLAYDLATTDLAGSFDSAQSGWYLQGVYQFLPRWRVGARYDSLDSGSPRIGLVRSGALTAADFPALASADPSRTTLMLDWSPSEFSRLRAQYAWDDARDAATDEQFFLQYIYSLGAHGAHKF